MRATRRESHSGSFVHVMKNSFPTNNSQTNAKNQCRAKLIDFVLSFFRRNETLADVMESIASLLWNARSANRFDDRWIGGGAQQCRNAIAAYPIRLCSRQPLEAGIQLSKAFRCEIGRSDRRHSRNYFYFRSLRRWTNWCARSIVFSR